jgi:hypothetical protein
MIIIKFGQTVLFVAAFGMLCASAGFLIYSLFVFFTKFRLSMVFEIIALIDFLFDEQFNYVKQ